MELQLLPQLPLSTSQQWLHTHELVGTTVLDQAATPDGVFDLMDASAAVAVTEANVEKVLLDCDDEPFPEVAYSLDDIRWASCASQAEIDASGLVGVTTGGAFTLLAQVRQLKQLCVKHRAVFATGKIPHANAREPVRVDLIPDPAGSAGHAVPIKAASLSDSCVAPASPTLFKPTAAVLVERGNALQKYLRVPS